MHSLSIHAVVSGVLRGRPLPLRRRQAAFAAPLEAWRRVLAAEGCAVQFERALHAAGLTEEAPLPLRRFLREATGTSLRGSVLALHQLEEIGELAARHGIRVLVLKGAARLLDGALGATRSMADIDILTVPRDGQALHSLLQDVHGYTPSGAAQPHHLAPLARPSALTIEIHTRLADRAIPLDREIWKSTRSINTGGSLLAIPSATCMLLHTLEHATTLNWMTRYRLRDILDVAAGFDDRVSTAAVEAYVRASPRRPALETLLSAAHELEPRVPLYRARAWSTVSRVSRARLAVAAHVRNRITAERLFRYVGVVAEASPATMARAGGLAARWLRSASVALLGA